ncbi:sensor domain-containing diguanylate cyclase [Herbaspirillum sp. B65]|uniref:sensor domain-containing diguanylate cyclase n=1 Tax=Herbaspirillum sp. B65 TaxID=137708 RepID=UPI00034A42FF|nr:GGDEF domain-containing protein [Herbaspirillum sp. B65]
MTLTISSLALMAIVITSIVLYQSYRQIERTSINHALNVTRIAQRSISRNLELLSLALDSLAWRYRHTQLHQMPPAQQLDFLLGEKVEASYIAALGIVNAEGELIVGSPSLAELMPGNFAGRDFFEQQRHELANGLYISSPLSVRMERRLHVMVLSKRLVHVDGSFAGIAFMVLYLDYFRQLFEGLSLEKNAVMSLYTTSGVVYMRLPYNEAFIGSRLDNVPDLQRMTSPQAPQQGSYFARSRQDGVKRLYAYVRVPHTNWVVFIGRTKGELFRDWTRMFYAVLLLTAAFSTASIYLISRLREEFFRRGKLDLQLEQQARTDKLTSLLNRRALDEALQEAWHKSQRNSSTRFAILFADVDFFKLYNDTYGHKAGDYALVAVARCIQGAVARQCDKTGRFGGEEFVVLLDEADVQGALHVAGNILTALQALKIPHERSPFGRLSLSIGVACLDRGLHQSMEDVVKAADEALYQAKRAGRNRVQLYRPARAEQASDLVLSSASS